MGTALTGLEIKDTYDGLVKTTDNGPLSGTAKFLSDGLGNDSALALSTTNVGIGTNVPSGLLHAQGANANFNLVASTGNATSRISNSATSVTRKEFTTILDTTNNRVDIQAVHQGTNALPITINAAGGNVGIGTTAPTSGGVSSGLRIKQLSDGASGFTGLGIQAAAASAELLYLGNTGTRAVIGQTFLSAGAYQPIAFDVSGAERFRVTASGVTFNGDTAAANALDDYEEGTWTMGVTFGGASVGVTYNNNLGTYTKIGRQVTVNGWVNISAVGSSTGAARITGLPFTVGNTDANYAGTTLACNKIAFANQLQAFAERGTNTILFTQVTEAGVESTVLNTNFQAGSYAIISLTYFV